MPSSTNYSPSSKKACSNNPTPQSMNRASNLLPLLREYAQEHLQKDPHWPQLQQQHLHYYAQLAQTADDQLYGPQQSQWLARLKAEEANCWAALHWSLDQTHPDHIIETGVKMSIALNNDYLRLCVRLSEAWQWTCQTLTFQKRLPPKVICAFSTKLLQRHNGMVNMTSPNSS